jgi:hypothetical protein
MGDLFPEPAISRTVILWRYPLFPSLLIRGKGSKVKKQVTSRYIEDNTGLMTRDGPGGVGAFGY